MQLATLTSFRCSGGRAGFSLMGGQTQSAYIEGGVIAGDLPFGPTAREIPENKLEWSLMRNRIPPARPVDLPQVLLQALLRGR